MTSTALSSASLILLISSLSGFQLGHHDLRHRHQSSLFPACGKGEIRQPSFSSMAKGDPNVEDGGSIIDPKQRLSLARDKLLAARKKHATGDEEESTSRRKGKADNSSGGTQSLGLIDLTQRIDKKIEFNTINRTGMRRGKNNDKLPEIRVQHDTDSMQSLLGYNEIQGEWMDHNSTTYHIAIVFGKALICDQVSVEYAGRLRTLAKMLHDDDFQPSLICFTGGISEGNSVSDASAGFVYFNHLCSAQGIRLNDMKTRFWIDTKSFNERVAMERLASELWRNYIKGWLKERPLTERHNQRTFGGWKILERRADIHFTLVSTDYHLCSLNDIHHRSPIKSFLQPLVSLRGLVGSDRFVTDQQELESLDPSYISSVHVSGTAEDAPSPTDRKSFGGIENCVDTSWSFQYSTYPFLHIEDDAVVFLGQCYLLGEELNPLLVNMKGVVEQTEFFQRDNYLLLSSIRRSLVALVEALYTDKGQEIRAGVIRYFEQGHGRNRLVTREDVKIIVVLEAALLNLGRCIDLVKPAGLLTSTVPAATWSRALDALEKSMDQIKAVCDPDRPLGALEWGKLTDDEDQMLLKESIFD